MVEPLIELQVVKNSLTEKSRKLEDIRQDCALLWQELSWGGEQVRLWLRSLPGIQVEEADSENPSYRIGEAQQPETDLGEIVARVVSALGRPVALGQLRTKLPAGIVATEPMIRAAIQKHPRLVLTGPLVRLEK